MVGALGYAHIGIVSRVTRALSSRARTRARGHASGRAHVRAIALTAATVLTAFLATTLTAAPAAHAATYNFLTGFEHGVISDVNNVSYDGVNNTLFDYFSNNGDGPFIDSTIVRTGNYSMRAVQDGSSNSYVSSEVPDVQRIVGRFAVYFDTLPTGVFVLASVGDTTAPGNAPTPGVTPGLQIIYNAGTSRFRARIGNTVVSDDSNFVPVADTWYVIDYLFDIRNPHSIQWAINGVAENTITSAQTAEYIWEARWGAPNSNNAGVAYFDDIALSTTATDYPLGDGRIYAIRPDTEGTHSPATPTNFQEGDNTGIDGMSANRIDEIPISGTADWLKQIAVGGGGEYIEFTGTAAPMGGNARAARGVGSVRPSITGANNAVSLRAVHSGGAQNFWTGSTWNGIDANQYYVGGMVVAPGGGWTRSEVDGLKFRLGYASDVAPVPFFDATLVEVEYPNRAKPDTPFTADSDASAGSVRPQNITATNPHFSFINRAGAAIDKQRVQVVTTTADDDIYTFRYNGGVQDATGNGHSMTLNPSPTDPSFDTSMTDFGQAMYFDGDDHAETDYATDMDVDTFTIESWVKVEQPTGAVGDEQIISAKNVNDANRNWRLSLIRTSATKMVAYADHSAGGLALPDMTGTKNLQDGDWHHVAYVVDSVSATKTRKLYVDGVLEASATFTGNVDNPADNAAMGCRDSGGLCLRGWIDEHSLSRVARTAAEIQGYYHSRKPHYTVVWDSDTADDGVAIASCNDGTRCADIVYGATGTPDTLQRGAQYWVRAKYMTATGDEWSEWSDYDWFQMQAPTQTEFLTGFEHGSVDITGGGIFSTRTLGAGSTITADTATVRSGNYAMRVNKVSAATGTFLQHNVTAGARTVVTRVAVRFETLPGTDFFLLGNPVGVEPCFIRYNVATNRFRGFVNTGNDSNTGAIVADRWYVLEMRCHVTGGTTYMDWYVDGVAQTGASYAQTDSDITAVRFGSTAGAHVGDVYYDDILITTEYDDFPLGNGYVLALTPAGQGTHNINAGSITNNGGSAIDSTSPGRIDEVPVGATSDFVRQTAIDTDDYAEFTITNSGEASAARAVRAIVGYHSTDANPNNGRTQFRSSSGPSTVIHDAAMNGTSIGYGGAVLTEPPGGWTDSELDSLKVKTGYSSDATPNPYWDSIVAEVEYASEFTVAAPTAQYTGETAAQTGTTNNSAIRVANPRFSWINNAGTVQVNKQRVQVVNTTMEDVVGLWRFDDNSDPTADESSRGLDMDIPAAPNDPAFAASKTNFGNALVYDGDDCATRGYNASYDLDTFTVEAWARVDAWNTADSGNYIVTKDVSSTDNNFKMYVGYPSQTVWFTASVSGVNETTNGPVLQADSTWHHIAGVVDEAGGTIKLYVDGVLSDTEPIAGEVNNPAVDIVAGSNDCAGGWFRGAVDDIRITGRALTEPEIRGYYNTQRPHYTTMWDSDTSNGGVAMSACTMLARCADITYGSTGSPIALDLDDARYYVRGKFKNTNGTWSDWSSYDWFQTSGHDYDYLTGFEHGVVSAAGGGLADFVDVGNVQAIPAAARNGEYGLRSVNGNSVIQKSLTTSSSAVQRVAIRLNSAPSALSSIIEFETTGGNDDECNIVILPSQVIRAHLKRAGVIVASQDMAPALSLNQWHTVDMACNVSQAMWTINWRVNGTAQTDVTFNSGATTYNVTGATIGNANASSTFSIDFDDWAISTSVNQYPIPDGQVVAQRPNAAGTHSNAAHFEDAHASPNQTLDTTSWTHVADSPLSQTNESIRQVTANTASYAEWGLEDTVGVGEVPRAVRAVVALRESASGSALSNSDTRVRLSTGTEQSLFTGNIGSTTSVYKGAMIPQPDGGWDKGLLDSMIVRTGYAGSVADIPIWDGLLVEYELPVTAGYISMRLDAYDADDTGPNISPSVIDMMSLATGATDYAETRAVVTTNAAGGYTLNAHDPDANGAIYSIDAGANIPWHPTGTVASPAAWGANSGIGISAFGGAATLPKWCVGGVPANCTAINDADLLWAGLTGTSQQITTKTSSATSGDTTRIPLRLTVPAAQTAGSYRGLITFTATAQP